MEGIYQRVYLKDQEGGLYKVFNLHHKRDQKGESYLKVSFPDSKQVRHKEKSYGKYLHELDTDSLRDLHTATQGMEISYHYLGGVAHMKFDGKHRYVERRNIPSLEKIKGIRLFCMYIYGLKQLKIYQSKKDPNDCIVPTIFDKPRVLTLFISFKDPLSVTVDESIATLKSTHSFQTVEEGFVITLSDEELAQSSEKEGIEIFMAKNIILD